MNVGSPKYFAQKQFQLKFFLKISLLKNFVIFFKPGRISPEQMFTADEGQSQSVWAAPGSLVELEFTGRCEIKGGMCGVVVVVSGGGGG